jgi:hypothetical protein
LGPRKERELLLEIGVAASSLSMVMNPYVLSYFLPLSFPAEL